MATVYDTPRALLGQEGARFGPTEWIAIEQPRVDEFARATEDHQWIHVDPVKAADGPFGATIAHGYLTMSLAAWFLPRLIEVRGFSMGINVGLDRLRFLNPVKVGARLRATGELVKVEEKSGGIQSTLRMTVEIEGEDRPALIADTVSRYYPENE